MKRDTCFLQNNFFLVYSLTGFLAIDMMEFKELSGPIKGIMIEEMLKLCKWLGKIFAMEVS